MKGNSKQDSNNGKQTESQDNMNSKQEGQQADSIENSATAEAHATDNSTEDSTNLEEKLTEANDKYIRLAAEFDNYRKRTLKERMDMMKYGGEEVIKGLLPVLDDMDRSVDAMGKTDDVKAIREGIQLIQAKLAGFLTQQGLTAIESDGKELDTDLHDAVTTIPAPAPELKGKIVDTIQKGYMLHDKVVRHSKVIVGE